MGQSNIRDGLNLVFAEHYPKVLETGEKEYFADTGALSSFELLSLILKLEEIFGLKVEDEEMVEENIGSRALLRGFIEGKFKRD